MHGKHLLCDTIGEYGKAGVDHVEGHEKVGIVDDAGAEGVEELVVEHAEEENSILVEGILDEVAKSGVVPMSVNQQGFFEILEPGK